MACLLRRVVGLTVDIIVVTGDLLGFEVVSIVVAIDILLNSSIIGMDMLNSSISSSAQSK